LPSTFVDSHDVYLDWVGVSWIVLRWKQLTRASFDDQLSLSGFSSIPLFDLERRATLFGEIFTPVNQTPVRFGRRLNTAILIRTDDESSGEVVCNFAVERKCISSSIVDEYRPNPLGKPVAGLPVSTDPFFLFAL
jgi:hypothetical protein